MAERSGPRSPGQGRRKKRRRPRIERSSGGVVFRQGQAGFEFLLIRDPYENWGLPKGHIEGDESPGEAALREVGEETGLAALALVQPLPTIDWYFRDGDRVIHKFCHFFLIESVAGEAVPQVEEGITACLWCSYGVALETLSYDNARKVLRAAGAQLGADRTAG